MAHSHGDDTYDTCCTKDSNPSVRQTLAEMEFERGIWYAALSNDKKNVEMLLQNGASVNAEDSSGYTALHYAVRNAQLQLCEMLLQQGANVNARTRYGQATALHRAAMHGRTDIVELLLRYGADPNLVDVDGYNALYRALIAGASTVCEMLIPVTDLKVVDNLGNTVEKMTKYNCPDLITLVMYHKEKQKQGKQ